MSGWSTWPVDPPVASDSSHGRADRSPAGHHCHVSTLVSASTNVAQARVPAPRLLILGLRFTFLLALEVRPGEGLHGGQETNLGHSPCQPQRFAIVLIHDSHSQLLSPLHATKCLFWWEQYPKLLIVWMKMSWKVERDCWLEHSWHWTVHSVVDRAGAGWYVSPCTGWQSLHYIFTDILTLTPPASWGLRSGRHCQHCHWRALS